MKTPYTLSTDYSELFDLIQDGTVYMGFAEHSPRIKHFAAIIFKSEHGYIIRSEHGAGIHPDSGRQSFVAMCESVNIKWIKP